MWRGGEAQVLELAKRLIRRGHDALVVCPPGSALVRRLGREGIPWHSILMRGEWDIRAACALARVLRRWRPDVVHLHTSHAHTLGLLACGLGRSEVRVVVSRRVDFPLHRGMLGRFKYGDRVDRFIAVSERIRGILLGAGLSPSNVITIHSGIDLGKFDHVGSSNGFWDGFGLPRGALLVGNVAALAPHKDQYTLLQAARRVVERISPVRFLIVGEGELEGVLRRQRDEMGLREQVVFTGFRWDVGAILRILDVFVLSSYLEGLGSSVLDAMLCALPVVATQVGGIPEMVADGRSGLLVPPRDPDALADAIGALLKDEDRRKRFGQEGRRLVERFDIEETVHRTERVYMECVEE